MRRVALGLSLSSRALIVNRGEGAVRMARMLRGLSLLGLGCAVCCAADAGLSQARPPQAGVGGYVVARPSLVGRPGAGVTPTTASEEGYSVALSSDGRTALVGSYGAGAWVFTRTGGTWRQQGGELLAPGTIPGGARPLRPGIAVALSAQGNTALIGTGTGAWVFTRRGSTWSRHGVRLFGNRHGDVSGQGSSVALSADGNTALVGAPVSGSRPARPGLVYAFSKQYGTWSEGLQLLAYGAPAGGGYGASVALSAKGNTALIGDDVPGSHSRSAAWVFKVLGKTWTQIGGPLRGSGSARLGEGASVALSADGKTALVSEPGQVKAGLRRLPGSAWVFTYAKQNWAQRGPRLTVPGSGARTIVFSSVALAADGATALIGGSVGGKPPGSVWTFTRHGAKWTLQSTNPPTIPCHGCSTHGHDGDVPAGPSLAASADGSTLLVGSTADHGHRGAAWVLSREP